jgi:hypothetical protein
MSTETRHFVLTPEGSVREFSAEQAALIAAGNNPLPEFADRRVRYLQVSFDTGQDAEIHVRTAGAAIRFDGSGRVAEALPPSEDENFTHFEHETCVQWALRGVTPAAPTIH